MKPAGRPGHGAAAALVLLVDLVVAPGMVANSR